MTDHHDRRKVAPTILRLITAAGLAVDAHVHFDLATQYDASGGGFSQGRLFRVEAIAAIVAALLVSPLRAVPFTSCRS